MFTKGYKSCKVLSHLFAGPMNPGAALIVNISANIRDGAFSHKIDHHTYFFFNFKY